MDSTFLINYMKISVLSNLKTDNIYYDILISLIFMAFIDNINIDITKIKEYINKLFNKKNENELSLFCEETKTYRGTSFRGSESFKGLLFHIKNKISTNNVVGLKKIKEYIINEEYSYDLKNNDIPLIFMSNQNEEFKLLGKDEPDIAFKVESSEKDTSYDGKVIKIKIYEFKLIGNNKINIKILQEYIEKITSNYIHYLGTHDDNLYVFNYNGKDYEEKSYSFKKYPFYTTCDMKSLFFENKDSILDKIKFFRDNKDWYKNKSKPYTLGICTYGPPGCGKTSFEKALAKMLNRHIIIVDISKFKTKDEADHVFFSEKINDRIIPYDKRLYVFPDFDCQSEITNERTLDKEKKDEEKEKEKVIIINNNDNKKILDALTDNLDKMNLSKLLNILDGIPERTGQIIIFNTNHPKHLDKALLRPGRMDLILNFEKISKNSMKSMMQNHFNDDKDFDVNILPDKEFTPAELFKILYSYDNLLDTLDDIKNWHSKVDIKL